MARRTRNTVKTNSQDRSPEDQSSLATEQLKFLFVGLLTGACWTSLGCLIAYTNSDLKMFIEEWCRVQIFPCLVFAIWLLLLARSNIFANRIRRLVGEGSPSP